MKLLISLRDISFRATKSKGISKVALGLCRGLIACPEIEQLHILSNEECSRALLEQGPISPHVTLHGDKEAPRGWHRLYWDQWGISQGIRELSPDWALLPKGFPPYWPRLGPCKLACYLHDINWEYYQDRNWGSDNPYPSHELLYFSRLGKRSLEVADLILCSTQFNKTRYQKLYPPCQPQVIGIGFEPCTRRRQKPQGQDILAYVSPYPHKRSDITIRYLQAWLAQRSDAAAIGIHLLGSLPQGLHYPQTENWQHHQNLKQAELEQLLMEQCRASVYSSDYEGYGLPPVENLRMGIPCVASDIPPIREHIPPHYLFKNGDKKQFIARLNQAYEQGIASDSPNTPSWQEVAKRAVKAMQALSH